MNYGEGIFVGYRYYDYKGLEPMFPFGFGLSYSSFVFSDPELSEASYSNNASEPLRVSVTVANTGFAEAKEVVQLYVHAEKSTMLKPDRELKAFQKITLKPGERKTVKLELLPRSFASYDTDLGEWTAEPGHYGILIGDSSRNLPVKISVRLTGRNPYGLSTRSSVADALRAKSVLAVLQDVLGEGFDYARLKSNANYFGSTRLRDFLLKNNMANEEQLALLDRRIAEIEEGTNA